MQCTCFLGDDKAQGGQKATLFFTVQYISDVLTMISIFDLLILMAVFSSVTKY